MDPFKQAQQLSDQTRSNFLEAADEVAQSVTNTAANLTAAGVSTIEQVAVLSTETIRQGANAIQTAINSITAYGIGIGTSGLAIADALKDLPTTAEALATDMPKIADRLRNRAGVRVGEAARSDADVIKLFEKIPGTSKLGASETKIRQFLADKHGSHIVARGQGGSNGADNIVWEVGTDNLRRGAQTMTGGEQLYIRFYNAVDSVLKNSATIAKLGITATGTAIITQALITAVAHALDLYRGDLSIEEFKDKIVEAAIPAVIAAPIFFLIFIAVLALFPELSLLLAAPAVVAGFNTLFGISVAIPIIQSLMRHVEAGGFGADAAGVCSTTRSR